MEDQGFNGSGSRFNSRFEAGAPIQAKQLNDLAAGVQSALPMPYLGEGPSVSFTPGGAVITDNRPAFEQVEPAASIIQQFQMRTVSIDGSARLQIAKGTVSFTQSNMPRVRLGGHNDQRQGWISKVAAYGANVELTSGAGDPAWMDGNGYYSFDSAGTYYVTIGKFDITSEFDDTDSELLNAEAPWVSIFKAGDPMEAKILSQTGPSEYVNKTNVHKMTGYDAASTGLSGDWGNCHTTWFNPTKWGYSVKLIGIVTATNLPGEGIRMYLDQHIVGPIDLQIPCLFNGTTLCNQDDLNETNDPYNLNKNSDPKWSDIVNSNQLTEMASITAANTDWYEEFVGPADWTAYNYSYLIPASCANQDDGNDDVCFPFKVKNPKYITPTEGAPYAVYNICPGTINNLMPLIYDAASETWVYMDAIPQPQINLEAGTQSWIVLRVGPDPSTNVFPQQTPGSPPENDPYPRIYTLDNEPPDDTDALAYVVLAKVTKLPDDKFEIDQYVTGSLWGDRIKMGEQTARYYYARI